MPKKVLLADDEEVVLNVAKASLEVGGQYELITASNGEEALARCQAEKPDLVLLDLLMPKKNGIQVCEEIRADEGLKNAKVVILTALSQESDRQTAMMAGADDYMTKPFSPSELIEKVSEILGEAA